MKRLNLVLTLAGVAAALLLSADYVQAQGGGGGGGGGGGFGAGGGAGGRGGRGGANFDPAQMQQMMLDNYRDQLGFTNDEEWNAIRPLIEKVVTARQDAQAFSGNGRGGRGGRGGGGAGGRGGGGFGGTTNPTVDALQTALDSNSTAQMKTALTKYRDARKQAQDKLTAAQEALQKVLTVKQEVVALQLGLVN